jgi:anaerobic magnesium-protoporphyrin IX monomethyl ester cyclase
MKPKLLLAYPPIAQKERYGGISGIFGGKQIPLGLFYLAAYARANGYAVDVVDAEARRLRAESVVATLREGGFNVLGISANTVSFHRALELASLVKQAAPETVTVIGGPHVSSQPAQPLEHAAFDYAVRNEGEETLVELLAMIEQGTSPESVLGLIHRRRGEIVVNPPRPYIADLDRLPFPAFDLIPDLAAYNPPPFSYRQRPVANVITSRGCPNNCTFCERATFGRRIRMRSAANIADEIELLMRAHGAKEIAFVDDTFTVLPRRIYQLFDITRARGLRFPWTCMSRVDTVDEELLRFMRDNGCWYIAFGIGSGDEAILKEIRRRITLADAERAIQISHRLGIRTKGFFIVGHPTESEASIDKSITFAEKLNLDQIIVTLNTPMPGSYQYEHADEFGTLDRSALASFSYRNPAFVPHGMTKELLLCKHREFLRRFYYSPGRLGRTLWRMLTFPRAGVQVWRLGGEFLHYACTPMV